jgi:hypothetical protein
VPPSRSELRGWDTPEASIVMLAVPEEEVTAIAQSHRWLVRVTEC